MDHVGVILDIILGSFRDYLDIICASLGVHSGIILFIIWASFGSHLGSMSTKLRAGRLEGEAPNDERLLH